MATRRERLLAEAMRLFGEQGYGPTSVAQIEEAAGLSPGAGTLYKHFPSKKALLEEGFDKFLKERQPIPPPAMRESAEAAEVLRAAVHAGFGRLEEDRDLNRVLFRGLDDFPELKHRIATESIAPFEKQVAALLAGLSTGADPGTDWDALAVILVEVTVHFWLLEDIFGANPAGVSRERFIEALIRLVATSIAPPGQQ